MQSPSKIQANKYIFRVEFDDFPNRNNKEDMPVKIIAILVQSTWNKFRRRREKSPILSIIEILNLLTSK